MTTPTSTPAPASSESNAEFVERMDRRFMKGKTTWSDDLERLIAIARRSAAPAPAGDAVPSNELRRALANAKKTENGYEVSFAEPAMPAKPSAENPREYCAGKGCWHDCHGSHGDCIDRGGCNDCSVRCEACKGTGLFSASGKSASFYIIERLGKYLTLTGLTRWEIQQSVDPRLGVEQLWTLDIHLATHFSRHQDAESYIRFEGYQGATVFEHAFVAPVMPAKPATPVIEETRELVDQWDSHKLLSPKWEEAKQKLRSGALMGRLRAILAEHDAVIEWAEGRRG